MFSFSRLKGLGPQYITDDEKVMCLTHEYNLSECVVLKSAFNKLDYYLGNKKQTADLS